MKEICYDARLRKLKTGYFAFYLPKEAVDDKRLKPDREYLLKIYQKEV